MYIYMYIYIYGRRCSGVVSKHGGSACESLRDYSIVTGMCWEAQRMLVLQKDYGRGCNRTLWNPMPTRHMALVSIILTVTHMHHELRLVAINAQSAADL